MTHRGTERFHSVSVLLYFCVKNQHLSVENLIMRFVVLIKAKMTSNPGMVQRCQPQNPTKVI